MTWCSKSERHVVTHIDIEPRQRHNIRPRLWVEYVWIYHFGLRLSSGAEDTSRRSSVGERRWEWHSSLSSLLFCRRRQRRRRQWRWRTFPCWLPPTALKAVFIPDSLNCIKSAPPRMAFYHILHAPMPIQALSLNCSSL